ncbi:MAG TPA: hypothetical protein VNB90_17485 [Cytophagaceae bacterium]|nr:hypothetical protein [Cytophagaceae bacterium]
MKNADSLFPGSYYHIYNHAVGDENLFRNEDNFYYFLQKYNQYIYPICETYAYSLMPNHFHFAIKVRNLETLNLHYEYLKSESKTITTLYPLNTLEEASKFTMQQFSNFFNSYTKSYNKKFDRKGALFIDYMKRKVIISKEYFTNLIYYIHHNPVHHNFCKNMHDWKFSSYHAFLSSKDSKLNREQIFKWFGDKKSFIDFHNATQKIFISELEF